MCSHRIDQVLELEHSFDILRANDIQIKGTRLGIETIVTRLKQIKGDRGVIVPV
jgi:hypothetical protein